MKSLVSILLGTAGLSVTATVALLLTLSRGPVSATESDARRVRLLAVPNIILQCVHLAEEWTTGFPQRFPKLFGLTPWPDSFFVPFNAFWIVVWIICVMLLRSHPRVASFPMWFLALASTMNGVVHPLLAMASGGYFPGLWSSPLVGICGVLLLHAMDTFGRGPQRGKST